MIRRAPVLAALLAATTFLQCGGDGGSPTGSSSSNRSPAGSFTVSPSGAAVAGATVVAFAASGSDPDGDAVTYSWNFGDGQTGTGQGVSHTFETAGVFNVVLTISDAKGGSTNASNSVTVKSLTGTWVDADPRITFPLTQSGSSFTGSREASSNIFIRSAPLNGSVANPRAIVFTIHFRAGGISSDCRYEGTLDEQADGFRVERVSSGYWCGQTSYTVKRQ